LLIVSKYAIRGPVRCPKIDYLGHVRPIPHPAPLFGPMGFCENGRIVFPHVLYVALVAFYVALDFLLLHFKTSSIVENGKSVNAEFGLRFITLGHPRFAMR